MSKEKNAMAEHLLLMDPQSQEIEQPSQGFDEDEEEDTESREQSRAIMATAQKID
jgi:hypothetical protein